jgi:hypothetical protein
VLLHQRRRRSISQQLQLRNQLEQHRSHHRAVVNLPPELQLPVVVRLLAVPHSRRCPVLVGHQQAAAVCHHCCRRL